MDRSGAERPERGRRIGRYVVRRRVGLGGFARVYRALDPELEVEVAVKLLKPELAADPHTVERFRREASTVARLRHPHVITVLTVGRLTEPFDGAPADTPYLVMDYLPHSLAERLRQQGALPESELLRVGEEVARGLAYAHQLGVVHRDVKPDNILFADDGRAVVTDFGIAGAVQGDSAAAGRAGSVTAGATAEATTGAVPQLVLGTPSYFSPEQARGLSLDGRSDVYALGVTLYQAATGTLPFPGENWYGVMRRHVEEPPVAPRVHNPALTPVTEAIVLRCLAKEPEERFASADELAGALALARAAVTGAAGQRAAAGESAETMAVVALADGAVVRRARRTAASARSGSRRGLAAAAVAAVLAGGALVAQLLRSDDRARTRERLTAADTVALPAPAPLDTGILRAPVDTFPSSAARVVLPGRLAVAAPPEARVSLDGVELSVRTASGTWASDSLPPGRHVVRAVVSAIPGCPTATVSEAVEVAAGRRRAVRLEPLGCGRVTFDVRPTPARFVLTPVGARVRAVERGREGMLPLAEPLLLPAGEYRLQISARACAEYDERLRVEAGEGIQRERIPLIC